METSTIYEVENENKNEVVKETGNVNKNELKLEIEKEIENKYELELEVESDNEIEIEMESPRKSSEDQFCPVLYFGYIMLGFFILAVLIL